MTKNGKRIKKDGTELDFIGAYVTADLKTKLQEWAKDEDRTVSQQMIRILREAVEQRSQ